MNMNRLNDEEFRDELRESLFDNEDWAAFLEPDVVDRTRTELIDLAGSLTGQLAKWNDDAEKQWKVRTKNLLRRVQSRIAETNAAIKARNRQQTATVDSIEAKWSALAFELAEALADSDMAFMLNELWVPGTDPILVADWVKARTAQRVRKAARLAEVS